jgi:hypothetical protein
LTMTTDERIALYLRDDVVCDVPWVLAELKRSRESLRNIRSAAYGRSRIGAWKVFDEANRGLGEP